MEPGFEDAANEPVPDVRAQIAWIELGALVRSADVRCGYGLLVNDK